MLCFFSTARGPRKAHSTETCCTFCMGAATTLTLLTRPHAPSGSEAEKSLRSLAGSRMGVMERTVPGKTVRLQEPRRPAAVSAPSCTFVELLAPLPSAAHMHLQRC